MEIYTISLKSTDMAGNGVRKSEKSDKTTDFVRYDYICRVIMIDYYRNSTGKISASLKQVIRQARYVRTVFKRSSSDEFYI